MGNNRSIPGKRHCLYVKSRCSPRVCSCVAIFRTGVLRMFSLVLVIIGVLLVAVLAMATMFYGGSATTQSQSAAEAAQLLNQSSQITTASAAYTADHNGAKPSVLQDLVTGHYLSVIPEGWMDPHNSNLQPLTSKAVLSANTCTLFNSKRNIQGIPLCGSMNSLTTAVCCQ
jgi:type II secretory pathway pseudopilin PulG